MLLAKTRPFGDIKGEASGWTVKRRMRLATNPLNNFFFIGFPDMFSY